MKKKLKLKSSVKGTLIVIVAIGVFGFLLNLQYTNAVNDCVNAGNSKTYCEKGLK